MNCPSCGTEYAPGDRFCLKCGAAVPPPAPTPMAPGAPHAAGREPSWWYPIGVWAVLTAFFLFIDLTTTGRISWAQWPIGIIGIFLVGFSLLGLADRRYRQTRGQ